MARLSSTPPARKRIEPVRSPHLRSIGKQIADRLRSLRLERGYDRDALATKLGLSQAVLQSYESGKRPIAAGTLYALAAALDAPISVFFDGLEAAAPKRRTSIRKKYDPALLDLFGRIRDPALLTRLNDLIGHLAINQRQRSKL